MCFSSRFFSQYVSGWWSLEHSPTWGELTLWELARVPWGARVHLQVEGGSPIEGFLTVLLISAL